MFVSIAFAAFLSSHPLSHLSIKVEKGDLVHKITGQQGQTVYSNPFAVKVVLSNPSKAPIKLLTFFNEQHHLDFFVSKDGRKVSDRRYGNFFTFYSVSNPIEISIPANGTYTMNAAVNSVIRKEHQVPGKFTVKASFEYQGLKIES